MEANKTITMEWNKLSPKKTKKNGDDSQSNASLAASRIKAMMDMLENTRDEELPCDEVHALLAQFAEAVTLGDDASELMPLVQQHLDLCAGCREEFEAVMEILNSPWGLSR
jgi:hypothetical protein